MGEIRARARQLVSAGATGDDHLQASRVAVGLFFPGLVLLIVGRPDLIIYAVFGSFTGMYGRAEPPHLRARHQAQAAGVLLTGVGIGVALSSAHTRPWVLVVSAVVFASLGSLVTDGLGLRPEGPFFGIFALGAIATVPAGHAPPWLAMAISAATALFCILVSFAVALRSRARPPAARADRPARSDAAVHAVRYGLAIAVAGCSGLMLGIDHANWAMAAAAVPLAAPDARGGTQRGVRGVVHRGIHRVVGTFAGLVVTALLLVPHLSPMWLAIVVIALLFPTELFMARNYGLALGFFTPLIMLMTELAAPTDPVTLLTARAIDTLIGVAAGIAVAVVIRPRGPKRRPGNAFDSGPAATGPT